MSKGHKTQSGSDMLMTLLTEMGQPNTLMNYLSIAGIDLPLSKEIEAELLGDFPQWEKEIKKLQQKGGNIKKKR